MTRPQSSSSQSLATEYSKSLPPSTATPKDEKLHKVLIKPAGQAQVLQPLFPPLVLSDDADVISDCYWAIPLREADGRKAEPICVLSRTIETSLLPRGKKYVVFSDIRIPEPGRWTIMIQGRSLNSNGPVRSYQAAHATVYVLKRFSADPIIDPSTAPLLMRLCLDSDCGFTTSQVHAIQTAWQEYDKRPPKRGWSQEDERDRRSFLIDAERRRQNDLLERAEDRLRRVRSVGLLRDTDATEE